MVILFTQEFARIVGYYIRVYIIFLFITRIRKLDRLIIIAYDLS